MADSKLCNKALDHSSDLIQCDICYTVIDQPKALPCLHTFCLKCLSSWHVSTAEKDPSKYAEMISCPNCREAFALPRDGVKGLRTNFFVNKLKEKSSIQKKLMEKDAAIPCTSCDPPSDNRAIGRCVECNDFLCKNCDLNHKSMRVLKYHHVLSLDELRAGKLNMHNLPEQEMCPKHKSEYLRFYCETCDQPMCRDCTVVDHPRPDHKQVDLTSATEERINNINQLLAKAKVIPNALAEAIQNDEATLKELDSNAEKTIQRFKETTNKAETEFTQKVRALQVKRKKQIEAHRDSLEFRKSRLSNAIQMAKQVSENGSEHDVASMYSSVVGTIQDDTKVYPRSVRKTLGKFEFQPADDLNNGLAVLGDLNTYDKWILDKTIASGGKIENGRYICFDGHGNVAVSTFSWNASVRFLKSDGQLQKEIKTSGVGGSDVQAAYPYGIVIGNNGVIFVTDQNPYVKVFDSSYKFKQRFGVKNPSNGWSYSNSAMLYGLAINLKGQLYIGCTNHRYVSISNQDGSHVSCFKVNLAPYFIAVARADHVIISDHESRAVHVYDPTTSNQLYTFALPDGVTKFYPSGLCILDNEVFVASYQSTPAIYCYTLEGKYISVVTKDVSSPWGIMAHDDEEELFVCNGNSVKIFRRK